MPAPRKYPEELKDRAVRLVEDLFADPEVEVSITGAGRTSGNGPRVPGMTTSPDGTSSLSRSAS
jgi:hypothetical protein